MLNFDGQKGEKEELGLPPLDPLIRLFKSTPDRDGEPRWSLYQRVSNQYYQIGWKEFECLARFHKHETATSLIEEVNAQTTLDIDEDDIKTLIIFLQRNGLLSLDHQPLEEPSKGQPFWKKIVHSYLYFTLPLLKPANFLKETLPYVRPFLGRTFMTVILVLLAVGIILTIQRFDEFTHTFLDMFSVKGALITFFVFTAIKIIHEFAHAFIATKHGVNVPHMGLAFIVMYPILYTETTASWRLASARKRIEIGLAGVMAELALAAIFLLLWHIMPAGVGRSIAFSVVAISLIGSLLINLNPMMRFDGYFVLSDSLNIENLHARAIGLARWSLRKTLFGLQDPSPDKFAPALQKFMIGFGFAIMVYRFFLFLGIAFLVYTVFLKPLGFLMMVLELTWFIGIPVWRELKIWWEKREDIIRQRRTLISSGALCAVLLFTLLPVHSTISVSAVLQASGNREVFAPTGAFLRTLSVQDGQIVSKGDVLAVLESYTLEKEYMIADVKIKSLEQRARRERTNIELYRQNAVDIENALNEAKRVLETLREQKAQLVVKAPFDGMIRDLSPEVHQGRHVAGRELLFRIVKTDEDELIAYIGESDLERLNIGNSATFHPSYALFEQKKAIISSIDRVNVKTLSRPELASTYGGDIPATAENNALMPLNSTYLIRFKYLKSNDKNGLLDSALKGRVRIKASNRSAFLSFIKRAAALVIRESGLN